MLKHVFPAYTSTTPLYGGINAAFTRNAFSNTFRIKRFSLKRFRKRLRSHGISETFSKRFENVLRSHRFNANNVFYI